MGLKLTRIEYLKSYTCSLLLCTTFFFSGCNHRSKKQQEAFDLGHDLGRSAFSEAAEKMSPDDAKEMAETFYEAPATQGKEFGKSRVR